MHFLIATVNDHKIILKKHAKGKILQVKQVNNNSVKLF